MAEMTSAWLVLNYDCNNRCRWCYAQKMLGVRPPMTPKTVVDALDLLAGMGISDCVLIGGEPTVYPDLPMVIVECLKRGIDPQLVTNGRRLSDAGYLEQLANSGLMKVCVSIESLDRKTHDYITRRPGSFAQTKAGMQNVADQGLFLSSATTISGNNMLEVPDMVPSLRDLHVQSAGFNIATPNVFDGVCTTNVDIPEAVAAMSKIISAGRDAQIKIHFAASVPLCMAEDKGVVDSHFRGSCFVYYGSGIVIDTDGSIIPCVHWVGADIDSIYREDGQPKTVEEFLLNWNDGAPAHFREMLWKYPAGSCVECSRWNEGECVGGCPLMRIDRDLSVEIDAINGQRR